MLGGAGLGAGGERVAKILRDDAAVAYGVL